MKDRRWENMDEYEIEKITRTLKDTEHLALVITAYLEELAKADKHNVMIRDRENLGWIRGPEAPAGPKNDIWTLSRMFEKGINHITTAMIEAGIRPEANSPFLKQ